MFKEIEPNGGDDVSYDYSKLSGKITEVFKTQLKFAEAMHLSERSVSLKLNGKTNWRQSEIERACELLHIDKSDIPIYFFKLEVQAV